MATEPGADISQTMKTLSAWIAGAARKPLPKDVTETALRQKYAFAADEVAKVVITIAEKEAAIVNNRATPDISLQHLVALMIVDGTVTFKSAHDYRRMRDPRIAKLRSRVELIGSPEMTDPLRRWHARAAVHLADGRTLEHYTYAARGSSYNPISRDEENAKALDLLAPVLGRRKSESLIAAIWSIERLKDLRSLRTLYRP